MQVAWWLTARYCHYHCHCRCYCMCMTCIPLTTWSVGHLHHLAPQGLHHSTALRRLLDAQAAETGGGRCACDGSCSLDDSWAVSKAALLDDGDYTGTTQGSKCLSVSSRRAPHGSIRVRWATSEAASKATGGGVRLVGGWLHVGCLLTGVLLHQRTQSASAGAGPGRAGQGRAGMALPAPRGDAVPGAHRQPACAGQPPRPGHHVIRCRPSSRAVGRLGRRTPDRRSLGGSRLQAPRVVVAARMRVAQRQRCVQMQVSGTAPRGQLRKGRGKQCQTRGAAPGARHTRSWQGCARLCARLLQRCGGQQQAKVRARTTCVHTALVLPGPHECTRARARAPGKRPACCKPPRSGTQTPRQHLRPARHCSLRAQPRSR